MQRRTEVQLNGLIDQDITAFTSRQTQMQEDWLPELPPDMDDSKTKPKTLITKLSNLKQ